MTVFAKGLFGHSRGIERIADTRLVSPPQFCELLVSRRNLVRSDDRVAKMRGLTDLSNGVRFLVKEDELAKLAQ